MVGRLVFFFFLVEDDDFKGLGPSSLTPKIYFKDEVLGYNRYCIA